MSAIQKFTNEALSSRLRQSLVASMVNTGSLFLPAIQQAFLNVPREAFISSYYIEDATSQTMAWKRVDPQQITPEDFLTAVYQDQSLVTKVDERNWPISSSSQPSVMAEMLEALDVQPGQRVLEIGTGTGYNAALLAHLTDDPVCVVTIEHDATLAESARQVVEQVIGSGVTVISGDGFPGWEQGAPYDRIIATASVPTLPMAWIEQLQVGGKLVMHLQGTLNASGFLIVEKRAEGVSGHFLAQSWHFMPLITEQLAASQPSIAKLSQQLCLESFVLPKGHLFPDQLFDMTFRWFLQWRLPGCKISKQKQMQRAIGTAITSIFVIDTRREGLVRLQQQTEETWSGTVYGSVNIWQEIQQAYEDFHALGEPQQQDYRLTVEETRPLLIIGPYTFPL
ncbi:MAG: rRNA adenine N-6-methyltransferase family protein [Ktedonobacteraceae bacterium]